MTNPIIRLREALAQGPQAWFVYEGMGDWHLTDIRPGPEREMKGMITELFAIKTDDLRSLLSTNDELRSKLEAAGESADLMRLRVEVAEAGMAAARAEAQCHWRDRLEAAEKDAARVDWLDAQWRDGIHVEACATGGPTVHGLRRSVTIYLGDRAIEGTDVRDAIDAALLGATKE